MAMIALFIARHSRQGLPGSQMRLAKALGWRRFGVDFINRFIAAGVGAPSPGGIGVVMLDLSRAAAAFFPSAVTGVRSSLASCSRLVAA